ncbi:MAG: SUMF1/EgtB/PvdO family nonheme iron enzyme, partial [Desulfobacteraceae bacterium]
YEKKTLQVSIQAGDYKIMDVQLKPVVKPLPYGRLELKSSPEGAQVSIDNTIRGNTPIIIENLPAGNQKVIINKKGYEKKTLQVSIKAGEYKTLDVQLKPVVKPGPKKKISNDIGMEFVYIQPGTFKMGSPSAEQGRYKDEHQHRVTLTRGYYIQTTEVTQHQWEAVMGNNPSSFRNACGKDCPVERVSWHDAQAFIRKLNQMEGTTQYRLPTEAQWEYACRAGSTSRFSFGNSDGLLDFFGWYKTNSVMTHAVGQKPANPWGLYDMHGNVWEWCQDWYGDYPSGSKTDPIGPRSGDYRVRRGGSWRSNATNCRSAHRYSFTPDSRYDNTGFRLARIPQ